MGGMIPAKHGWSTTARVTISPTFAPRFKRMDTTFFSDSDTETLLRAYLEFGAEKFLHPFRGMFALAIWDVQRVTLTLARDRVGKKPLYYWRDDEWLVFGSEIKTLLEHPAVSAHGSTRRVIPHYLAYGYPPAPETLVRGNQSCYHRATC